MSVRTLLIRHDEPIRWTKRLQPRSRALRFRRGYLAPTLKNWFEMNTEDENGDCHRWTNEKMWQRGETVEPFQRAAFALREEGEFSEPVVSRVWCTPHSTSWTTSCRGKKEPLRRRTQGYNR